MESFESCVHPIGQSVQAIDDLLIKRPALPVAFRHCAQMLREGKQGVEVALKTGPRVDWLSCAADPVHPLRTEVGAIRTGCAAPQARGSASRASVSATRGPG